MTTPEKLMRYAWGYAPPLILDAAVRNGVFDALEPEPKSVAETARMTGASVRGLSSIMNALVGMELLTRDEAGRYGLTEEAALFLVSSKPSYLGGMLKHSASELIPRWLHLAEIVRSGNPVSSVNQEGEGTAFFTDFVSDLFALNYAAASAAAEILAVSSTHKPIRVLDLAAGSGVWSIAAAQRSKKVSVTAVDWLPVLQVTKKTVERFGLSEQYQFVPGDLDSADFGSGYNVALLGHILHSEGVERSRSLLRKTYDALAPGGTAVIAEFLVNADRRGPLQGLIFGVNMLVNTEQGNTYSFEEIREWLEICGFVNVRSIYAPGPSPLIFADKNV